MMARTTKKNRAIPIMFVWATGLVFLGLMPVTAAKATMMTARLSNMSQFMTSL